MTRILAAAVAVLLAGWTAADALTPSAVLLAAAAVPVALAVAGLMVLAARRPGTPAAAGAPARHAAAVRVGHLTFVRHRDPDAAGRLRPRAPSAGTRAVRAGRPL